MKMYNLFKRLLVKLLRVEQKNAFDEAKLEKMKVDLIANNRKQDKDITTCDRKLIQGLTIQQVALENAGGWLVSKEGNRKDCIVYYIHGGGFAGACTKERMPFVSYVVNTFGYNVFSLDYRLAPEFMYPCGLNDCVDGYRYLLERYDPNKIVLVGESAGGNFVLTLSMYLRDHQLPLPRSVYANSPATQLVEYTPSYEKYSLKEDFIVVKGIIENLRGVYCGEEDPKSPYISPLYGDMNDLPPITLSASECECLLDDSVMMYEKLRKSNTKVELLTYKDLCHAFVISPQMKEVVKQVYPDFKKYLDACFGG